jgi:hypothetical protein
MGFHQQTGLGYGFGRRLGRIADGSTLTAAR